MAERRNNIRQRQNQFDNINLQPIRPQTPPLSEIAQDIANERRTITAEYFGPGLEREEYLRQGFPE